MKFLFLTIFLAFVPLSGLQADHYDYIYKKDGSKFYQAQTEEEFLKRKQEAYGQVLWSGLTPLLTGVAVYTGYQYLPKRTLGPAAMPLMGFGAFSFFISTLFSGLIQNTLAPYTYELQEPLSGFVNSFRHYWFGPPRDPLHKLEVQYIKTKPLLLPSTQSAIESNLLKLRTLFNFQRMGALNSKEESELRMVKQLLAMPVMPKPITYNHTLFLKEFSAYQNMTSANPMPELERFCQSLALASRHENPRLKLAIYLQGPPGVGKTESVFKLGNVLDTRVIKINLAELSHIGQIKGIRCEFPDDNRCTPGILANAIIDNARSGYPYKTFLILFDEADHVLNRIRDGQSNEFVSFMLDLLEGKTQFIENPYFGTFLDIRHFAIAMTGNHQVSNKAINNRVIKLLFGNYTEGYRIQAGRERFLPDILKDYSEVLKLEDFTEQDLQTIDAIATAEHEKLLTDNEDPGFRNQIREIERFVHQKAQRSPSAMSSAN